MFKLKNLNTTIINVNCHLFDIFLPLFTKTLSNYQTISYAKLCLRDFSMGILTLKSNNPTSKNIVIDNV